MENRVFLNRYRLSLGRNGLPVELHRTPNGITYRAQEIDSGREVAIELLPWVAPDESASADMRDAAAAAGQIKQINIPALHDFGIEDGQLVYVTDYFEGCTAEAWVAARGPLTIGAVLRVALQVAGALAAASFHRIQHPAINPANIIFVPGQTAEGDWPAIKVLHWLEPNVAVAEGNNARADAAARFASPEQLRGAPIDFPSTIFSLGCTMWFLLTGSAPALPGAKGVRAGVANLRGVPKIVRHLLGRMLRVDPAERPQDPMVLQAYLQTCLARVERREAMSRRLGVPLAVRRPRVAETRSARNFPVKRLALAALLLLCATLAVFALPRFLRSRHPARASAENTLAETTPALVSSSTMQSSLPNEIALEPAAPAEGPDEIVAGPPSPSPRQTVVAVTRDAESTAPAVAMIAAVPTAEPSVAPVARKELPAVASTSPAAAPETVVTKNPSIVEAQSPPLTVAEVSPPPTPAPTPRKAKVEVAKTSARKKSRSRSLAAAHKERSRSHNKRRVAHAEVRRGRQIPSLRVGSSRAELVGTTADGRWILSVASSGERIIVPPPPGFGP